MQPDTAAGVAPPARERGRRRHRGWTPMVAAALVLLAGLAASAVGASAVYRSVERTARRTFDTQALTVTASLATAMQSDMDFVAEQRAMVLSDPDLTNAQFAAWYRVIGLTARYPGGVGFGFVAAVPAPALPAFASVVERDPPSRAHLATPYRVIPPGPRAVYCLQRFGSALSSTARRYVPATYDLCSPQMPGVGPSPLPPLLDRAATTGTATVLTDRTVPAMRSLGPVFIVFAPAYTTAGVPTTPAARRRHLAGWMVGTFSGRVLLDEALGAAAGNLRVTLTYAGSPGSSRSLVATAAPATPTVAGATDPPKVTGGAAETGSAQPVTTVGRYRGRGTVTTLRFSTAAGRWSVSVAGRLPDDAWGQATIVAGLGLLVSALLFVVVLILSWSRARALRLVDDRTGQLRHLALHDPLTGLPNRLLVVDRAEQMLRRARRRPASIVAMFIDLDNFKEINDTFGHQVGDELLRAVADRLASVLRAEDTVGRIGGDEFVVLSEGDAGPAPDRPLLERIQEAMDRPFDLVGLADIPVTVQSSIGVAAGLRPDAHALLSDADVALYAAKEAGKNRAATFTPAMRAALEERIRLELDLAGALERGEFALQYLPTYDLRTLQVSGVEALLRWHHPTRGVLAPAQFLERAEQTGQLVAIGHWALRRACAQVAGWDASGPRLGLSVNVSAGELDHPAFAAQVTAALREAGLPPDRLTLDIAESVLMRDRRTPDGKDTTARLHVLKGIGVRIAVDEFGTGHSSLTRLHELPVDAIKIDRSFLEGVAESPVSGELFQALVDLGRRLGLDTLVAGVETGDQLALARRDGCRFGQGFALSPPCDPEQVPHLLNLTRHHGHNSDRSRHRSPRVRHY